MMNFTVENIKCGGCANSIKSKLLDHQAVDAIDIDIENGIVNLETQNDDDSTRQELSQLLHDLGYPEVGTSEGLDALKTKATSFVSCAVGRMKD